MVNLFSAKDGRLHLSDSVSMWDSYKEAGTAFLLLADLERVALSGGDEIVKDFIIELKMRPDYSLILNGAAEHIRNLRRFSFGILTKHNLLLAVDCLLRLGVKPPDVGLGESDYDSGPKDKSLAAWLELEASQLVHADRDRYWWLSGDYIGRLRQGP